MSNFDRAPSPLDEPRFTRADVEKVLDASARAHDLREHWIADILRRLDEAGERMQFQLPLAHILKRSEASEGGFGLSEVVEALWQAQQGGLIKVHFPGA